MNERFFLFFLTFALGSLILVLVPACYILRIRLDSVQKEAILKGHAEWQLNEDDPKIKQFTFK